MSDWTDALEDLYKACKPLAFDCIRSEEETKSILSNIEAKTINCIQLDPEKINLTLDLLELVPQKFGDQLTEMYDNKPLRGISDILFDNLERY